MLCVIKNKLIDTQPTCLANETSNGKENEQNRTIQHNYNNDDLLQYKTPTSLSTLEINNKKFNATKLPRIQGPHQLE